MSDETPEVSGNSDDSAGDVSPIAEFKTYTADFTFLPISLPLIALVVLGHQWPLYAHLREMGAFWEFDYADMPSDEQDFGSRITRCYEIAGTAIVSTDAVRSRAEAEHLPMPEVLVHGRWSSPETRDTPIHHAWVVLDDGNIWEPISRTICDAEAFARYTQCVSRNVYDAGMTRVHMLMSGHYGRWA